MHAQRHAHRHVRDQTSLSSHSPSLLPSPLSSLPPPPRKQLSRRNLASLRQSTLHAKPHSFLQKHDFRIAPELPSHVSSNSTSSFSSASSLHFSLLPPSVAEHYHAIMELLHRMGEQVLGMDAVYVYIPFDDIGPPLLTMSNHHNMTDHNILSLCTSTNHTVHAEQTVPIAWWMLQCLSSIPHIPNTYSILAPLLCVNLTHIPGFITPSPPRPSSLPALTLSFFAKLNASSYIFVLQQPSWRCYFEYMDTTRQLSRSILHCAINNVIQQVLVPWDFGYCVWHHMIFSLKMSHSQPEQYEMKVYIDGQRYHLTASDVPSNFTLPSMQGIPSSLLVFGEELDYVDQWIMDELIMLNYGINDTTAYQLYTGSMDCSRTYSCNSYAPIPLLPLPASEKQGQKKYFARRHIEASTWLRVGNSFHLYVASARSRNRPVSIYHSSDYGEHWKQIAGGARNNNTFSFRKAFCMLSFSMHNPNSHDLSSADDAARYGDQLVVLGGYQPTSTSRWNPIAQV